MIQKWALPLCVLVMLLAIFVVSETGPEVSMKEKCAQIAEGAKACLNYAGDSAKAGAEKIGDRAKAGVKDLYEGAQDKWNEVTGKEIPEEIPTGRKWHTWTLGLIGLTIVSLVVTYFYSPWVRAKIGQLNVYLSRTYEVFKIYFTTFYYRLQAFLYKVKAWINGTYLKGENAVDRAKASLYDAKAQVGDAMRNIDGAGIVDRAAEGLTVAKDKAAASVSTARDRLAPIGEDIVNRASTTLTGAKNTVQHAFSHPEPTLGERAKDTLSKAATSVHDAVLGKKQPEGMVERARATINEAIGVVKRKAE